MNTAGLKQALKRTILFDMIVWFRRRSGGFDELSAQSKANTYFLTPLHDLIRAIAREHEIKVFFETGTYLGNTVFGIKDAFEEVYSVELSRDLAILARERFAGDRHVQIINADSSVALGQFLHRLDRPAVFWLDAHYSAGVTAKGKLQTPVKDELRAILSHPIKRHCILIDDVKDFNGNNDYPTVAEVLNLVSELAGDVYDARVDGDIFRIEPFRTKSQRATPATK